MLSRTGRIALSSLVVAAVAIGFCTIPFGSVAGRDNFQPHKLTILFTGDDWGTVKPCG